MTGPTILITGASSGIGAALAREYAEPGAQLYLTGRDAARLQGVAHSCAAQGAEAESRSLDVADATGLAAWIEEIGSNAPLDLVIANAGISAGTGKGTETTEQARRIFAINVDGVLNTVFPAAAVMAARGGGQIAIMSSLAAFRGFPGAPAYCASKAAVRVWGEALRGDLHGQGISVSVICPGYVRTPMTAVNRFPMPFLMDASKAARIIRRGLAKDRPRIAFPWPTYAAVRLLSAVPARLSDRLLRRLPAKE